jgi:hypothetical protein
VGPLLPGWLTREVIGRRNACQWYLGGDWRKVGRQLAVHHWQANRERDFQVSPACSDDAASEGPEMPTKVPSCRFARFCGKLPRSIPGATDHDP